MKLQTDTFNILAKTSDYLRSGLLLKQPLWYNIVKAHPPLQDLTHQPKRSANKTKEIVSQDALFQTRNRQLRNAKPDLFKPAKLKFIEDDLRDLFYHQHPWEFARAKVVLETSGNDAAHQDWSHMRQLNTPLEGESVVQRTMWLVNNAKKEDGLNYTMVEAYDKSRFEFYRNRMEDDLEVQISKEESEMYCATYGKSLIESGFELEQAAIEKWKEDATEATRIMNARQAGPQLSFEENNAEKEGNQSSP